MNKYLSTCSPHFPVFCIKHKNIDITRSSWAQFRIEPWSCKFPYFSWTIPDSHLSDFETRKEKHSVRWRMLYCLKSDFLLKQCIVSCVGFFWSLSKIWIPLRLLMIELERSHLFVLAVVTEDHIVTQTRLSLWVNHLKSTGN